MEGNTPNGATEVVKGSDAALGAGSENFGVQTTAKRDIDVERNTDAERGAKLMKLQIDMENVVKNTETELGVVDDVPQGMKIGETGGLKGIFYGAEIENKQGEMSATLVNPESKADLRREKAILASNAEVRENTAIENYGADAVETGANLVGMASEKEIRERKRDDLEDAKVEAGEGWDHDIMTRSQEGLTKATVKKIDKILAKNAVRPRDLEKERHLGMTNLLKSSYARMFGERN